MRWTTAWAALLAACAAPSGDLGDAPSLSTPKAALKATYDPEADAVLLAWSSQDAASCTLDGVPVETSATAVPMQAPGVASLVDVALSCVATHGATATSTVRVFHGPGDTMVVGGDGVAPDELSRVALVHGSLRLDSPDLADGAALGGVEVVTRSLVLGEAARLKTVDALGDTGVVYGDLIVRADVLTSLAGFDPGRFRGGLTLDGADGLVDLTSLPPEATAIAGHLTLVNNRSLASLAGAERLADIGGALRVVGNPTLIRLADLDDLGLSGLKRVGGDIAIESNMGLEALWSRAAQLDAIGGGLQLIGNPALLEADGLSRVEGLEGDLILRDNDALLELPSLFVTRVGGDLVVRGNALLDRVGTFGVLTDVDGTVAIEENEALLDLDFLAALERIGDDLRVDSNPWLDDVSGLGALTSVSGDVAVARNPSLCTDAVDAVLRGLEIGGTTTNVGNSGSCR